MYHNFKIYFTNIAVPGIYYTKAVNDSQFVKISGGIYEIFFFFFWGGGGSDKRKTDE